MKSTQVYYPPRDFGQALEGFSAFARERGLKSPEIDPDELDATRAEETREQLEDQRLAATSQVHHHKYLKNRATRYDRFMTALEVARAKYRRDSVALRILDQFKRTVRRAMFDGSSPGANGSAPSSP